VTQVPALVIAVSTGITVTRSASDGNLSLQVMRQITAFPKTLLLVAAALGVVGGALGWAVLQRREVLLRERLARRFTEAAERVEAMARYSDLSPLHDTRPDHKELRALMDRLAEEIRQGGEQAAGPGHYALGRGHLALGDEATAREELKVAWDHGFREPRAAYALALVLGRQYQAALLATERVTNSDEREAQRREVERLYRVPALEFLKQVRGAEVPSPEYVAASIDFYEGQLEDALAKLDKLGNRLPWFYEASKLRGDILLARATRHRHSGEQAAALADLEAGRHAYAAAAAIGESVPSIHEAAGELEYEALVMAMYGQGDVDSRYTQGLKAVSRALSAAPDHYDSQVLEARFHWRLTEYRKKQGQGIGEFPAKAVAAAERALALAPDRSEARLELGRSHWIWAEALRSRAEDPREHLRKAVDSYESIPAGSRDYGFHSSLGLVYMTWADAEEEVGADPRPNLARALESYLTATRLNARLPEAWSNLGIAYYRRALYLREMDPEGDLVRAQEALEKARALNPRHVTLYLCEGLVHRFLAQRRRARGKDAAADLKRSVEMFQKGLEISPDSPSLRHGLCLVLVDQARDAWDRGRDPFSLLDEAEGICTRAVELAPQQATGYINLGEVFVQRALLDQLLGEDPSPSLRAADQALLKALKWAPKDELAWANLGMVHAILGTFEVGEGHDASANLAQAETELGRALALKSTNAEAWFYLGETLGAKAMLPAKSGHNPAQGEAEALQMFEKALELAPTKLEFQIGFGRFLGRWAQHQQRLGQKSASSLERGLDLVDHVLMLRPDWTDARLLRAHLLELRATDESTAAAGSNAAEEQKQWAERALTEFKQVLSANPALSKAWGSHLKRLQADAR